MAKSLGLGPDGLIRSRPDPKQTWRLPVKDWIRELYSGRFGCVMGAKPEHAPEPTKPADDEEAARRYEEELYWEDYWERNRNDQPAKRQPGKPVAAASAPTTATKKDSGEEIIGGATDEITGEDVPF
jgi:hypothetical protein